MIGQTALKNQYVTPAEKPHYAAMQICRDIRRTAFNDGWHAGFVAGAVCSICLTAAGLALWVIL